MRLPSLPGLFKAELVAILLTSVVPFTQGVDLTPIPSPDLDLSQLGRVALVGDFDAISLYTYQSQSESGAVTNGSESIVIPLSGGGYATIASADGHINAMCSFIMQSGVLAGIIVGGNFTSLGGMETTAIALVNPNTNQVTPLPGLSGQVNALLCDQETNTVYVGGDLKGANSTNAIAWVGMTGWANLPFAGFNAPVTSIMKAPSGGNIVFGGSFSGLGNATTPTKKDGQVINLSSAQLSTEGTTTTIGFKDPKNIVCKVNGQDGPGNTWLLADGKSGFWRADMRFGYIPTKLRLWNAHQDGRGTKTFRFTAMPIDGIMNFTYTDPLSGKTEYCDARCPLSNGTSEKYRDFKFVNPIGMSGFRIDISDWYGPGGGLDGIELFEDDIFAYAVDAFNEPNACGDIQFPSNTTTTGSWSVTPSGQSQADYLTATVGGSNSGPLSVVLEPDIKQSGNYSVVLYTPGCQQDNTCDSRGIVTVNATLSSQAGPNGPLSTQVYQTNMFDKYDSIYLGNVDACSDSFRPSVTITPMVIPGKSMKVVASRAKFQLISSTGGLNGLFEFDPNMAVVNTDFSTSAIDRAGTDLNEGAAISSLSLNDGTMYVAGNFSTSSYENIMSFSKGKVSALPDGGLNAGVLALLDEGDFLYIGGNFTGTSKGGAQGLKGVAAYSFSKKAWQALGGGVNGQVNTVAPLPLNITGTTPETTIALGGNFDQILAFGNTDAVSVDGLAVWVPSKNNWLNNIDTPHTALQGKVVASTNNPKNVTLIAGTLASSGLEISGAVSLSSSDENLVLGSFPVKIQPQTLQSSKRKRALPSTQNVTGVATGLFYENGGRNITCLGGHFSGKASNGSIIENLALVNGSNNDIVTGVGSGLDSDSIILTLNTQGDLLFAGGLVSGQIGGNKVNGIISYDLLRAEYTPTQPPALSGDDVVVNSIAPRPGTAEVYVGGNFDSAGSLDCTAICMYETTTSQWNRLGTGIEGNVEALSWETKDKLIAAGNLTVANNATTMATYDTKKEEWSEIEGASFIPGPVTALCQGNSESSHFWTAGKAMNGSSFLIKYDGSTFIPVGDVLGKQTVVRGLQMLALKKSHDSTPLLDKDHVLLLTGQLDLLDFGNASAALFNGTAFTPFMLSTTQNGQPGSLAHLFASEERFFPSAHHGHSLVFVVFISMLCALGCIFLIIIIGIIIQRIQRRNNGYVPAPTYTDKHSNVGRIRPEELFQSLGRGGGRAPGDPPMI